MNRPSIRNLLLTTTLLAWSVVSTSGATLTVTTSADNGPGSLRSAVAMAAPGDSIVFAPSTDGIPILLLTGEIPIGIELTIIGNDTTNTMVSGSMLSRIFSFSDASTVKLVGLHLAMGQTATDGGALNMLNSDVELWDCSISNSMAGVRGGGIYANGGSLLIMSSSISGNTASGAAAAEGGGGIYNDANMLTINAATVLADNLANGASGSGGALFSASGTVQVISSSLEGNSANRAGGGIEIVDGILFVTNSDLIDNDVSGGAGTANPGNGGGLHATGAASIAINGATVTGNSAAREGGGLWNSTGTMTIDGTTIDGNTANGPASHDGGGGVFNNGGTLIIQNSTLITNNVADGALGSGGGVFNEVGGTLTVSNTTISGNSAVRAGGGIEDNSGSASMVSLTMVTLDGNSAGPSPGNGGGMHITGNGSATITGGTVSGNTASQEGGGLWNSTGTMTIDGTTIDGNTANAQNNSGNDQGGGGVFDNGGITMITDATISNNMAPINLGNGGGVMGVVGSSITITGGTISGNMCARAGGGIENNIGTVLLTDVIVNGNSAGINGGGLHASSTGATSVNGGSFQANTAGQEGGGLWNASGIMIVDGSLVDGNTAAGAGADQGGGGLFNNGGTLTVQNGTMVTGNSATGEAGSGGGILNDIGGTLTVTNSTISGNSSIRAGGGIEQTAAGSSTVLNNVILSMNATGGSPGNGGGMHITGAGSAMITGGEVNGNTATLEGGGLWNGAGTMVVDGTTIDGNTASGALADQGGGGIFNLAGLLTVQNGAMITNNMANGAAGSGGGIMNDTLATVTVLNSTISGNSVMRAGGGIEVFAKSGFITTLTGVTVTGNSAGSAPGNGGGFHITGPGIVNVNGGAFTGNTAAREGGGLWNATGTMTINGTVISGNTASGPAADDGGGGVFNNGGTLIIQNNTMITNNVADGASGSGGGVFDLGGVVTIDASTISMNECVRAGGAIESAAGNVTVTGSQLNGNDASAAGALATIAPGNGGAVHVTGAGTFVISGSTVDGNAAGNEGGGLWAANSGAMTVSRSTVSNNTAPDGGGLFLQGGGSGTLDVNFSTVSGNTATNGGGVQVEGGSLFLLASTIANNSATTGGGSNLVSGAISSNSSLIADNSATTGPDFNGAFASVSFTLVENGNGATGILNGIDGNNVGVDPGLLALASNGGATLTHAVGCGSPALDAGDPVLLGDDQRGSPVFNGQRDMGAFEYQSLCTGGTTSLELVFGLDDFGSQTTWQIAPQGGGAPVASGGPYVDVPGGSVQTEAFILADGCYILNVFDAAGDGIAMGGYVLRTSDGDRIIDNAGNFSSGSVSALSTSAGNGAFCLPLSGDRLILSQFDKVDWVNFRYLIATENTAVSATWVPNGSNAVQPNNSGYVFWIFDPNGTYSYRRFRSHKVSDGFSPANATRACHMKVNGWVNTVLSPNVPANVLMNVRVRSRVGGVNGDFGEATRFMIDPARAACPLTKLQDVAGNKFSCGVSKDFAYGSYIYAKPPQFIPAVSASTLRYQFRFRNTDLGFETIRQSTNYILPLYWTGASALQCGVTYTVDVRVSKDNGATWCIDPPTPSTPFMAWGELCTVTINPCSGIDGPVGPNVLSSTPELTMYPNPNSGGQVFIALSEVDFGVNTVNMDIYDLTGKRVYAKRMTAVEGPLNTVVELGEGFSNGVYLVNITAGERVWNQRLVIQR